MRVDDGVVNLTLAEMLVGKLNLKFEDKKTGDVGDAGKTRPDIILRQLNTKPGQVCNRWKVQSVHPSDIPYHKCV